MFGWEVRGGKLTGPPIAPRMMASAFFAAVRASSARGEPVASMEHLEDQLASTSAPRFLRIDHSYPAEQMLLEIELDFVSLLLDHSKDLKFISLVIII